MHSAKRISPGVPQWKLQYIQSIPLRSCKVNKHGAGRLIFITI
nr:MAG TPA: hypothetical protein [Caudoviricetes sp.]